MTPNDKAQTQKTAETAPNTKPKSSRSRGRPASLIDWGNGMRVSVYLDAASIAMARELGNGNASEGIRRALILSKSSKQSI